MSTSKETDSKDIEARLDRSLRNQVRLPQLDRSFDAAVKFDFDPTRLGKIEVVCVMRGPNSRSSCSFLNFGTGLIFFFI